MTKISHIQQWSQRTYCGIDYRGQISMIGEFERPEGRHCKRCLAAMNVHYGYQADGSSVEAK